MTNTDPTDEIASVEFAYIDVFATAPLTGAPLTLVTDADGLTDIQMRAIAREFNQSETTFLQSPSASGATRRLRSFTPTGQEVLGAGHNALGAWLWLAASGQLSFTSPDATFSQQIGADVLPVQITRVEGRGDVVTMDQSPPVFGATVKDRTALVEALGLDEADLVAERPAQVVSTGAGHLLVAIADRAAVDRAAPDPALLTAALHDVDGEGCYLYTHDTIDAGATAYARFFNPAMGIWEDPATGTAAGPLAALLVAGGIFAPATTGGTVVVIEQGHSMGRPSTITVTVSGTRVRVSGSGLIVAQGTMSLSGPPPVPAVVNRNDEPYLRRAITLATHARADGNAPFASLLVDAGGDVLAEQHNTVLSDNDITAHPELKLARWAAQQLTPTIAAGTTLYTNCRPCQMCSGAIDRSGIGRVVYALSNEQLAQLKPSGGFPTVPQQGPALLAEARAAIDGYYS